MAGIPETVAEKHMIETNLQTIHSRLKAYANDQIQILNDIMSIIEAFHKTEKYLHEKMRPTLQKSLDHIQGMSCIGPSVPGAGWKLGVQELLEHYSQREASCVILKQPILDNLKKLKHQKNEEHSRFLMYDEEIIKEMSDVERRTIRSKRVYEDACERLRQFSNPSKEKKSGIELFPKKSPSKSELARLELQVNDTRNAYIINVDQMNFALKFYVEKCIDDLDKLIVCDMFKIIEKTLNDLTYGEYQHLRDTLQRAIHAAIEDGDREKKTILSSSIKTYPLALASDHSDRILIDEKNIPQLVSMQTAALNESRELEQQIQSSLDTANVNHQSRDQFKFRLKRIEMRKAIVDYLIERLAQIVPKSQPTKEAPSIDQEQPDYSEIIEEPSGPIRDGIFPDKKPTNPNGKYPCQAIALYNFTAAGDSELSIRKDDRLFLELEPDGGWVFARGTKGAGFVPENYVRPMTTSDFQFVTTMAKMADQKSDQMKQNLPTSTISEDADYFSDE